MDDTDAVPLVPRPDLTQYRRRAKELAQATRSADPDAVRAWAAQWLATLLRLHGQAVTTEIRDRMDGKARRIQRFAHLAAAHSGPRGDKGALATAQFVLARIHGFDNWPSLSAHIQALADSEGAFPVFESAVDATVTGDVAALDALLRQHPGLTRARSPRKHQATLLHYVSANGVEPHRQRVAQNVIQVTEHLLNAGADLDAPHSPTPRRRAGTALGLVATSMPTARANVQIPLMQTLLDAGAAVDGVPGGWQPLLAALANGCPDAADLLAGHGARMTMVAAAGLGRLDLVERYVKTSGGIPAAGADGEVPALPAEPSQQLGLALAYAAVYGHAGVVEFLLEHGADPAAKDDSGQTALHHAAHGGHLVTVDLLLRRGVSLEATNIYGSTVLGQVVWSAANHDERADGTDPGTVYLPLIERLISAGARTDAVGIRSGHQRIDDMLDGRSI